MGRKKKNRDASKDGEESTPDSTKPKAEAEPPNDPSPGEVEAVDDNEETNVCPHARQYKQPTTINTKGIERRASSVKSIKCLICVSEEAAVVESEDLWFCMHCYETRCGRYSQEHGLKHFEIHQSHCLTLSVVQWRIWCYQCDKFIASQLIKGKLESSLSLAQKAFKKTTVTLYKDYEIVQYPIGEILTHKFRVIGLQNLGNTCYFNSALQNLLYLNTFKRELTHTLTRTEFCLVPKKNPDLPPITFRYTNKNATTPGLLTNALSSLIQQTKTSKEADTSSGKRINSKKRVCCPREVQQAISKRHKKFSNGSQQDSHELLRFLIDLIKDEEIKRLKVAFLDHFDATEHKKEFKTYSEERKNSLKKYASEFKNIFVFTGTFIDDVFGGKMLSIVRCHSCSNIFSVDEDFLDLSLSLPVEKYSTPKKYQAKPFSKKKEKQLNKAAEKVFKNEQKKRKTQPEKSQVNEFELIEVHSKPGEDNKATEEKDTATPDKIQERMESNGEPGNHLNNGINGLNLHTQDTSFDKVDKDEDVDTTPAKDLEKELAPEIESNSNDEQNVDLEIPDANSVTNAIPESNMEVEQASPDSVPSKDDTTDIDTVPSKDDTADIVKPKGILRLTYPKPPLRDSLQHFITRFFSAEILEGDYLCTHCNPQLVPTPKDEKTGADGDRSGSTDERESSQESIDLTKCIFTDATKQFHIKHLPPILTIHLKRFSQIGARLQKINRQIDFPLVLDMSPYCTDDIPVAKDCDNNILYGLRGIVNHTGGMVAGHYIAYVNIADWGSQPTPDSMDVDTPSSGECSMEVSLEASELPKPTTSPITHPHDPHGSGAHVKPTEDWYYISDSHVSKTTCEEVFNTQAYILFYERLPIVLSK